MAGEPSRSIRLFGTEEEVPPPRVLRAGALSVEFEAGNLRYIRFGGIELIRAISFIVRDRNWGTYDPVMTNLAIDEGAGGFRISYDATAGDARQSFGYAATIEAGADGRLHFHAKGRAANAFVTNRTGFVVLHPGEAVAGKPVTIEHVDGTIEQTDFPVIIDPVQPMMEIRALTHEAADGLRVTCRMEGDTYEMEDQRNWTDASFKTYVRPLARPWPYTIEAGHALEQAVTLTLQGNAPGQAAGDETVHVRLEAARGTVPFLGAGLDPSDAGAALKHCDPLRRLGLNHLICHHDPRRGHDGATLVRSVDLARAIGAEPWLEAVITSVDAFDEEIAALGETVRQHGLTFDTMLVSPAPDLKCTLPGSIWPPCPPLDAVYRAARSAFPRSRLGGGMFSYFTELNRKRPPLDALDLVTFTTSAIVHAGDDRSVMEGLGSLSHIARSAAAIAGEKPYAVGPSAIGMRDNPYGDAPAANPENIRQAMNFNDPRQRGLLGAAWATGYFASFADGGAAAVALGGLVGAFGVLHAPSAWPAPWYDDRGGLYPVYHVVKGLAALGGRPRRNVFVSDPRRLAAVAADGEHGCEIWLANLTAERVELSLDGVSCDGVNRLDEDSFIHAAADPGWMDGGNETLSHGRLLLGPYGVTRVRVRALS